MAAGCYPKSWGIQRGRFTGHSCLIKAMETERPDAIKDTCVTGLSEPNEAAACHNWSLDAAQHVEEQDSSKEESKIICSSKTTDSIATGYNGSLKPSQQVDIPTSLDTECMQKAFGQNETIASFTSCYQREEIQNSNMGSATEEQKKDSKKARPLSQTELKQQERMVLKLCQEYEEEIKAIPHNVCMLREEIREQFQELYYFLIDGERATDAKIRHQGIEAVYFMESKVEEFTKLLEDFQEGSVMEVCLAEQEEELLHIQEEFQYLRLELVGNLPLQYRTWKRMRSIIKPALEPLSLDPETVHSHLTLSKNLRAVKLSPSMSSAHMNSESLNTCLYALASQGFLFGKHYWEVDVGDKTNWIIGVASALPGRQVSGCSTGCVLSKDLSPENGFWVLSKCPGEEYRALKSTPVTFKLNNSPTRFGIYLDMESDNICFYDAETMVQIFALRSDFKGWGKIHPFFCPGWSTEDSDFEPLRVCVV